MDYLVTLLRITRRSPQGSKETTTLDVLALVPLAVIVGVAVLIGALFA